MSEEPTMSELTLKLVRWWRWSSLSPKNWWYFIRCHTYTRYHLIDCRSKENDYSWGYQDVDGLMFYTCFNLLKTFVEKEKPFEYIDYDSCDADRLLKQEIVLLYNWWCKGGRAEEHRLFKLSYNNCPAKHLATHMHAYLQCEDDRDDEMFDRLMKIRRCLWT